ncbi:MAG: PKD domain-containing protein [Bacteroidetes bacterium]|nr:PKD domain-containing protein [Bacteroidota bacterium]
MNAAGNYSVELIVTNANGCSDTAIQNIIVHPTPTATASVDLNIGCAPLTVQFNNTSVGATTYIWNYGNGTNATTTSPGYTYAIAGNYIPQLIAGNNFGCLDTFDFNPGITALLTPDISFTSSSQTACYGDVVNFLPSLVDTTQPTYIWDFGFTTSTQPNPGIISSSPGIYAVSLIVTNSNGCSDTLINPTYLEIYDTIPPAVSPIASVSVLSDDQVIITWFNGNESDIAAYKLYRYNPVTSSWNLIYTDNNPILQSTANTSSYTDNGLNTKNNTYTYLIQTTDRCGYELPLSSSTAHTTIDVSTSKNGLIIFINWTPYIGCPISSYNL